MAEEQKREEVQNAASKDKKFRRQMGAMLAIGIILAVAYYKGKANEQRDDKMKKTQATAQDEVAKRDTTRPDNMPHGLMGGDVRTKSIAEADTAFVQMSEKQEEAKKADAQKKNAPNTVVNVWDESAATRGGGGSLPAGVAPDGSAGSSTAQGPGVGRPPSFIPDSANNQDPNARANRDRYYDPRYYYKTQGGYVRPGYQTGSTTPSMDKLHEAMETAYFASFASPTTVGADPRSAESLKVIRSQFADIRFAIWPGQPPARPIKDAPRAASQGAQGGEARVPIKPKVQ